MRDAQVNTLSRETSRKLQRITMHNLSSRVGSWLVVYFNPTLFMPWHEDALAYATRILSAALRATPPPQRIAQVWVLTNSVETARLY
jgi:hypothetical protein